MEKRSPLSLQFAIFCGAILVALPLRCFQFIRIIEPGTGFYDKKDVSVWILYALILGLLFALFGLSYGNRKWYFFNITPAKRPVLAIFCLLLTLSLVWNAVNCWQHVYLAYQDLPAVERTFRDFIKTGILPKAFEAVTGTFSAVYFVLLGSSYQSGRSTGSNYKLLALFPVIWGVSRIIYRFTRTISFLNVSDLLFELLMLVFLLVFLMTFIQLNARVNCEGSDWKLPVYGFFTAFMCLLCFVPRFVLWGAGRGELLAEQSPPEYCDLAMALFLLGTLSSRLEIRKDLSK